MVDKIKNVDDLKRMQSAASMQGANIPNYNEWNKILVDLEKAGLKSTGSFSSDKALHNEVLSKTEDILKKIKLEQTQKLENQAEQSGIIFSNDDNQELKQIFANATSSTILSNYLKYFHELI